MMLGNKAEKAKKVDEDDDNDSEDRKQFLSINQAFSEQSDIMQLLFDFVDEVLSFDPEGPLVLM